jgi:hypothetical protein
LMGLVNTGNLHGIAASLTLLAMTVFTVLCRLTSAF